MNKLEGSIEDIQNAETVCLDESHNLKSTTVLLMHVADFIGFSNLTQANLSKWTVRLKMAELAGFTIAQQNNKPWWPTPKELRDHIGLKIETRNTSDESFDRWIIASLRHRASPPNYYSQIH